MQRVSAKELLKDGGRKAAKCWGCEGVRGAGAEKARWSTRDAERRKRKKKEIVMMMMQEATQEHMPSSQ